MAGLTAARALAVRHQVLVIDKGRGVGGRMATRRLSTAGEPGNRAGGVGPSADHGAQFLTTHSPEFAATVAGWQEQGLVAAWFHGLVGPHGVGAADGHVRYRGVPTMNAIARHLACGLSVQVGTRVSAVRPRGRGWVVETDRGVHEAQALVMTPPVPQSLDLLTAGGTALAPDDAAALGAVRYDPCLALMVPLAGPSGLPAPGAVDPAAGPIEWMADNQIKGVAGEPVVTIHADAAFTLAAWDAPLEDVARPLLAAAALAGEPILTRAQLHRWRYARPVVLHPEACLVAAGLPPLVFAGDAFGRPAVEGAALSGAAAAAALT